MARTTDGRESTYWQALLYKQAPAKNFEKIPNWGEECARGWKFYGHLIILQKSAIKIVKVYNFSYKEFCPFKTLKTAIKTAEVVSLLTKHPTFLKSAIKNAKVCSLSDDSLRAITTASGWQFVGCP